MRVYCDDHVSCVAIVRVALLQWANACLCFTNCYMDGAYAAERMRRRSGAGKGAGGALWCELLKKKTFLTPFKQKIDLTKMGRSQ